MIRTTTAAALIALAGNSAAQFSAGSLLYISDARVTGNSDTVNALDYNSLSSTTLFTYAPDTQDTSVRGGLAQGPSGEFYVGRTDFPEQDPSTADITRIDDLFGTPSLSVFTSGPSVQAPGGIQYDALTDSMIVLNNPGSAPTLPRQFEGVQSYDYATGAFDGVIVPQNAPTDPAPRIQAVGGGLIPTGRAAGQYYFGSLNGGADVDPQFPDNGSRQASVIARMQLNNAADPLDDTTDVLIDLSPSLTGNGEFISLIRGMDTLPDGDIVFSDLNTDSIWRLDILPNGDAGALTRILDLEAQNMNPSGVIYNPFTNKLNYIEFAPGDLANQSIVEINLDGTGRNVLASGLFSVNSLVAIPTPATTALLGLGGLAAARRRR